jgi:acyl dehydratase
MGKYFEDLKVGDVVVTRGRTVTEADITQYAGLCWDTQREHTNLEFAKKGPFGARIAQQQLGLLIAHGLMGCSRALDDTLVSVLRLEWHFLNPVKIGDTLRVKMSVLNKKEVSISEGGLVTFEFETINQRDEIIHQCRRSTLVARRPTQGQQEGKGHQRCQYVFKALSDLERTAGDAQQVSPGASPGPVPSEKQQRAPAQHTPSTDEKKPAIKRGKYYEEFEIGEELITEARTVAEADVINYTMLSWDNDPLHTDAEFGRFSSYGGMLAPLLLPIVFANGLGATLGYLAGTNRGALGDWWEFVSPVRVGDTLHFRQVVIAKKDAQDPDTGIVTYGMEMLNQNGTVVSRGERSALVARLPQGEVKAWKFVFGTVNELAKERKG